MNARNLWTAALCGAALTTLVSNVPYIGFINCLLFAGFWGGAIFAVWFYRRLNGSVTFQQSIRIGLLTGVCAGIMGFGLSFLNLAGLQGFMRAMGQILPADAALDEEISAWAAVAFNLFGVLMNILFGTIGGWIAGLIFRAERQPAVAA